MRDRSCHAYCLTVEFAVGDVDRRSTRRDAGQRPKKNGLFIPGAGSWPKWDLYVTLIEKGQYDPRRRHRSGPKLELFVMHREFGMSFFTAGC
jgi:hypothetical protein